MYNLGDDSELDRLSREAAGRYQHPGKPNWQQMEAELDKALPTARKRRFGGFWLLPVLIAAGGAAYWLSTGLNEKQVDKEPATTNNPVAKIEHQKTAPPAALVHSPAQQPAAEIKSSPVKDRVAVDTKENNPQFYSARSTVKTSGNQSSNKSKKDGDQQAQVTAANAEQLQKADNSGLIDTIVSAIPEKKQVTTSSVTPAALATETTGVTPTPATENKTKAEPPLSPTASSLFKEPTPFGKGWSLGFVAGIDKSTVKFAYSSGAGFNAGIMAGYHFNRNFSLHTGAIYTQKKYKMNGSDFTPPKGSWVNYYKLENVDGDCSMWEVPLLARYSFAQHGRNSFFASTGLSSYFMTHENYSYFFYYNNQPITRSMDYKSDDTHILSILHLSAGYEHQLSNKLSMIIEPYAKIPLAGVGLGNIQLSSFGLNFSLQLRQPAHK